MKKFAILGFGTVGSGVAEVWSELENAPLAQGPILVRRDYPEGPFSAYLTKDFAAIENDPDVAVVAEVMGGADAAYEYTKRALMAGKSVVSSNKELVAAHGPELVALAREKGVSYLFEGSVGGGIPVLRPLTRCLAANRVDSLCGILNGTTNFILTSMKTRGMSFADALSEAQALGYAEADPNADVQGHDAGRKTAILASLAFGGRVSFADMSTQGIAELSLSDLELAKALGFEIKLLGRAARTAEGVFAFVAPHLVPKDKLLASVEGVMNACLLQGSAVGEVMLYGPGAGKRPTASAVCADILAAAEHPGDCMQLQDEPIALSGAEELESRWYVRAPSEPAELLSLCPGARPVYGGSGECGFITGPMSGRQLQPLLEKLGAAAAYRVLD